MKTTRRQALQLIGYGAPALLASKNLPQAGAQTPAAQTPAAAPAHPPPNPILEKDKIHHPLRPLQPDQAVFFNSDHSPIGCHASLVYGMEASGGLNMMYVRRPQGAPLMVQEGILVAVKDGAQKAKIMPFCPEIADKSLAEFTDKSKSRRLLRACVDAWDTGYGVSWTHFTPYWTLPEIDKASPADLSRFLLPATWMSFRVDNSKGSEVKTLVFSLLDNSPSEQKTWGNQHGFVLSKTVGMIKDSRDEFDKVHTTHGLSIPSNVGALLTAAQVRQKYGVDNATTAIEVSVPAGKVQEFTAVLAHHHDQTLVKDLGTKLYLTRFYPSVDDVVAAAAKAAPASIQRAQAYRNTIHGWGLNPFREFLYGHALASYMFNTRLFLNADGSYIWSIIEGEYDYINTFDLVVDQVFLELDMHPWSVRNELDLYAQRFHFVDQVAIWGIVGPPDSGSRGQPVLGPISKVYPGGLGFCHDMGTAFYFHTPEDVAFPNPVMSQEELQNWIICAALYWKKTNDNAWVKGKTETLNQALQSMLLRDDVDPAKRDGITTYTTTPTAPAKAVRGGEITTFDSLDFSLSKPWNSAYITTKSFAAYLALEAMFKVVGDTTRAAASQQAAKRVTVGMSARFDRETNSFPARFGGEIDARVIPTVEGLCYPWLMGFKEAVSVTGPYGDFIQLMKTHMNSILVPGICIDKASGAWRMSSSINNTWESKIYLAQFVTEQILGIKDDRTNGKVDGIHYQIQVLGNCTTAWTDQILSDVGSCRGGSRHYPRGVTAQLWGYKTGYAS
jgi:hypothetical protein